jgi:protein-S-isoprenylcysteine O-methyltransferase Ste14
MKFTMIQNSLATLGFFFLLFSDFLWVKGKKPAAVLRRSGYLAVFCGIGVWSFSPSSAGAPGSFLSAVLIAAAAASSALLLWSVFIEIGAERKKHKLGPTDVIRSGSYGLCRHPGFWWFAILIIAIGILKGFSDNFLTIFIMIGLDLLLILFQDRYTFPKVFRGYDEYRKAVPFLIPRIWKV